MSRVIAVAACGVLLAACSMSMPSLDMFRSAPPTEVLRIESEPPGADARTAEGQSCRTPCELTVPSTGEVAISFALPGYNPQTINVRAEAPPAASYAEAAPVTRLQPNPVYAEAHPLGTAATKENPPPRRRSRPKNLCQPRIRRGRPRGRRSSPSKNPPAPIPRITPGPRPRRHNKAARRRSARRSAGRLDALADIRHNSYVMRIERP